MAFSILFYHGYSFAFRVKKRKCVGDEAKVWRWRGILILHLRPLVIVFSNSRLRNFAFFVLSLSHDWSIASLRGWVLIYVCLTSIWIQKFYRRGLNDYISLQLPLVIKRRGVECGRKFAFLMKGNNSCNLEAIPGRKYSNLELKRLKFKS